MHRLPISFVTLGAALRAGVLRGLGRGATRPDGKKREFYYVFKNADVGFTLRWADVGVKEKPKVRDLWAHVDVETAGEYSVEVPSHGVVLLRVW